MLKGSIVALVTPFLEDSSINYKVLEELIEYHIENQTDGIVILGTTAEASTLSFEEEEQIVRFCVEKVNHRVPLIVGSGSNETAKAIRQSKIYSELGADYLLVITPYYNKTNENGLISHFSTIADAATCPIILYNVPSRTGMSISLSSIETLSKHPNIYGIKEASGDISYAVNVAKYVSKDFIMLSGNDDMIVPMMSIGACGVISVLANIAPKQTHQLVCSCLEGNFCAAAKIQLDLLDVVKALFYETNPIPVKEAMNYLGFNVGGFRLPLYPMSEMAKNKMIQILNKDKELIF